MIGGLSTASALPMLILAAFYTLTGRQGTGCLDIAVQCTVHFMQRELSRANNFNVL